MGHEAIAPLEGYRPGDTPHLRIVPGRRGSWLIAYPARMRPRFLPAR